MRDSIECESHRGWFWFDGIGCCPECGGTAGINQNERVRSCQPRSQTMTQIEPTDMDIAEARSLAKIPMAAASHAEIRALAERPGDATHLTLSIIAHAQTIAELRVATAFLDEAIDLIKSGKAYDQMCCSGYECGCMGSTNAEHFLHFAEPALARITQETPDAG